VKKTTTVSYVITVIRPITVLQIDCKSSITEDVLLSPYLCMLYILYFNKFYIQMTFSTTS